MQTTKPPALGLADVVNRCFIRALHHWRALQTDPRQEQYQLSGFLPYQVGRKREAFKNPSNLTERSRLLDDKSSVIRACSCSIKLAGIGEALKIRLNWQVVADCWTTRAVSLERVPAVSSLAETG
jgi:hypothetical protein